MVMTPRQPGAIAVLQIINASSMVLRGMTGRDDWPVGRFRLVDLAGIDHGLVGRIAPDVVQILPHGGLRVVQKLLERLARNGAYPSDALDCMTPDASRRLYPEAGDDVEALTLSAVGRAMSPLAVDLLADQPRRWRAATNAEAWTEADDERSHRLNRLITPPLVVLVGVPNVGKSTLTNALAGRSMSVAYDQAGTTRDYVAGRLDLGGLVVDWHDTPGLRSSDDPIEQQAREIADRLMARADLLIAMTDHEQPWPATPRTPDLRLAGKADLGTRKDADVEVCPMSGDQLRTLVSVLRERLVPSADLACGRRWRFSIHLPE